MNEVLLVLLSLSVSGSILALLLFALRPLIKTRLSQTWQYYIWLVVILRFLLPFSPEISVVGEAARHIENSIAAPIVTAPANVPESGGEDQPFVEAPQEEAKTVTRPVWRIIVDNIWMLWFIVALAIFTHRIIVYNNFTRYVRGRAQVTTEARLLDIYQTERTAAKVRRKLPLRVSDRVGTPMLIGIFRPMLVLPILEAGDEELRQIFRHELTHYKRLDYLYKWIVQFTICLHWFNPLVYRIGRQIDKSCELSCDEAVIRGLDDNGRVSYGRALMASLKSQENYSSFVISMTMSDNAKTLKERIDMIMKYNKKSKFVMACTVILTVVILFGAGAMGAYAANTNNGSNAAKPITIDDNFKTPENTIVLKDEDLSKDVIFEMNDQGVVVIPFSISNISEGYICIGQIPNLNDAIGLLYEADAESGTGLFISTSIEDKNITNNSGWHNYFGTAGNQNSDRPNYISNEWPNLGRARAHTGNYYVYVGTTETALQNITGTITVTYSR